VSNATSDTKPAVTSPKASGTSAPKTALVTGAAGGIGSAVVRALTGIGWRVFAADINPCNFGNDGNVIPLLMDVTDIDSVITAYNLVRGYTARLDAAINISGIGCLGSLIEDGAETDVRRVVSVNLFGTVNVNRVFFPLVLAAKGRVINFSSECGYMTAQPFNGAYTISKYAVEAYNDSLRRELMFCGVRVIKIQPGAFKTSLVDNTFPAYDAFLARTALSEKVLLKMKPLMKYELSHARDPEILAKTVLRAVTSKRPSVRYRVKNSLPLRLLDILPDRCIDFAYRVILK